MHPANSVDATDTSTRTPSYTAAENGTRCTTILAKRYKYFCVNRLDNKFGIFKGLQHTSGVMRRARSLKSPRSGNMPEIAEFVLCGAIERRTFHSRKRCAITAGSRLRKIRCGL